MNYIFFLRKKNKKSISETVMDDHSRSGGSSASSSFVLGSGQHLITNHNAASIFHALGHSKRVVLGVLAMDKKAR
jgi:hypothetical protein